MKIKKITGVLPAIGHKPGVTFENVKAAVILAALNYHWWNVKSAAEDLDLNLRTVYSIIYRHKLWDFKPPTITSGYPGPFKKQRDDNGKQSESRSS